MLKNLCQMVYHFAPQTVLSFKATTRGLIVWGNSNPWPLLLKEPTGLSTLILKLSSLRYFCAKHRDFSRCNFCTLCRILQVSVPIASLETVQKQCRNRALTLGQIKNDDFCSMTWWRFEWPQRYIWYIGRWMPTRLRNSQGSGHFCIMAFCICHLPLLAWRFPFFEMKLTLLA